MNYAKIIVKNEYENDGDLVLSNYIEAIKKANINILLGLNLFTNMETAFIFGIIKEDNRFHELFTDRIIDYDNYEIVPEDGVIPLRYLSKEEVVKIRQIMNRVIFTEENISKKYIKK
jgi:hypothetical protein